MVLIVYTCLLLVAKCSDAFIEVTDIGYRKVHDDREITQLRALEISIQRCINLKMLKDSSEEACTTCKLLPMKHADVIRATVADLAFQPGSNLLEARR
jgi:hypothetical protein